MKKKWFTYYISRLSLSCGIGTTPGGGRKFFFGEEENDR